MQNSWNKGCCLLVEYFVSGKASVTGVRSSGEAQGNADIYCRQPRTARTSCPQPHQRPESRLQLGPSTRISEPRKYSPGHDVTTPENERSQAQIFTEMCIALLSILLLG